MQSEQYPDQNNDEIAKSPIQQKFMILLAAAGSILLMGAGALSIIAYQHKMTLPTYLASLGTPQISVAELASSKLKSMILIDVRSPLEYQEDHIGNSPLVPIDDIEQGNGIRQIEAIAQRYEKKYKSHPTIVLYCTSGMRSIKASKYLSNSGYKVLSLSGGITAWRSQFDSTKDQQILSQN